MNERGQTARVEFLRGVGIFNFIYLNGLPYGEFD